VHGSVEVGLERAKNAAVKGAKKVSGVRVQRYNANIVCPHIVHAVHGEVGVVVVQKEAPGLV
jgi:hypothetical protein